ncbi:diuretic hormone receptor-like isoform X3 [Daphnia pulicaria]|uniref:diuretic hormone receptor-like isoform X3 n=1 Tax=Daphnia pulicaria TaxID=35523 RepID=UPI001EEC1759|nr:diuretic hormone receptor-like isoform X3 [Daphnia pulicaria]
MASESVWPDQSADMTDEGSGADKTLLDDAMGLEELMALNITNENELDCLFNFLRESYPPAGFEAITSFCNSTWDGVSCWPTTLGGSTSVLPCVDELNGIKYDTTHNATRVCQPNGTWANYSNYRSCVPLSSDFGGATPEYGVGISEDTTTIYFTGYTVSIVALTLAIWIFIHFKDLRCLRNTIHTHLLITYIMADLLWIVTATLQLYRGETNKGSCIIVIFLHYFHLTNFFWMFVEGFYLYMLVVETFSADKIRLRIYAFIGWGIPLPVVIVWAVVKANWFTYTSTEGQHQKLDLESFLASCPWMAANSYDWIYMTPAIVVLFVNILFLVKIMWVLITKLRSANSVETQQYRKGSKALLVLIPLLGLTYVLVIAGPTEGLIAIYFSHIRAVLLSTQGFLVTLFFCFLNTEVRNTLRHHWTRWKTTSRWLEHSQNHSSRSNRCGTAINSKRNSKDGSRAPCESTRLYSNFPDRNRCKRDSSFSEVTTVASFGPNSAIHLNTLGPFNSNGHQPGELSIGASTCLLTSSNGGSISGTVTAVGRYGDDCGERCDTNLLENQV